MAVRVPQTDAPVTARKTALKVCKSRSRPNRFARSLPEIMATASAAGTTLPVAHLGCGA